MQSQLARNKQESQRNAKRFYMLRGTLVCGMDGRRLIGRGNNAREDYYYVCSKRYRQDIGIPQCDNPMLYGPTVETRVWDSVSAFLSNPRTFLAALDRRRGNNDSGESEMRSNIGSFEAKLRDVDERETELVSLKLRGLVSDVAIDRNAALLRAERVHWQDEIERQRGALATLEQSIRHLIPSNR